MVPQTVPPAFGLLPSETDRHQSWNNSAMSPLLSAILATLSLTAFIGALFKIEAYPYETC